MLINNPVNLGHEVDCFVEGGRCQARKRGSSKLASWSQTQKAASPATKR